jgi:hypothetical protein
MSDDARSLEMGRRIASACLDRALPQTGYIPPQRWDFVNFRQENGSVADENIDGHFVRTTMLYGRRLTQGTRVEPWAPTVALGAASDGACLRMHLHTATSWSGRLLFDTPRHRQNLGLDMDYPRLHEWQEWWGAEPGRQYVVSLSDGSVSRLSGEDLAAGLPLTLAPGADVQLGVCGV